VSTSGRRPKLWQAIAAVAGAAVVISSGILFFDAADAVPVLLVLAMAPAIVIALAIGVPWREVEKGLVEGMTLGLKALVILLIVGTAIAAWAASGTIAVMIDYGLAVLGPTWFLPAAVLICSVVSLAIGSSWATAATVGVALMGIGGALGVPPAMSAGAILSGSYFGDKMSPLSDTTNLAPGIAGAELFDHIHAMLYTTIPAYVLSLIGFAGMGFVVSRDATAFDAASVETLRNALQAGQDLSVWLLLPPVLVVGLALRRVPALPVLVIASATGVVLAMVFQGASLTGMLLALYDGYVSETGDPAVDKLLSRGGMASMSYTIALVLAATAFGGVLERVGFIRVLLEALLKRVKRTRGLLVSTVFAAVGTNFLIAEQYLAIVLPGRMFKETYRDFGLQPRMLSRTLEDAGTVTSPLCPWNSCGAYMAAALGVSTFAYLPFALFNLLMPLISLVYAVFGIFILRQQLDSGPAEDT
jgi:Na+:H+ antiporter, NhaC family